MSRSNHNSENELPRYRGVSGWFLSLLTLLLLLAAIGVFLRKDFYENLSSTDILLFVCSWGFLLYGWKNAKVDEQKKKTLAIGCLLWYAIYSIIGLGLIWAGYFPEANPQDSSKNNEQATETVDRRMNGE